MANFDIYIKSKLLAIFDFNFKILLNSLNRPWHDKELKEDEIHAFRRESSSLEL